MPQNYVLKRPRKKGKFSDVMQHAPEVPMSTKSQKPKRIPCKRYTVTLKLTDCREVHRTVWWNGEDVMDLGAKLESIIDRQSHRVVEISVDGATLDSTPDSEWWQEYMVASDRHDRVLIDDRHPRHVETHYSRDDLRRFCWAPVSRYLPQDEYEEAA
jgi:hypothetical protein